MVGVLPARLVALGEAAGLVLAEGVAAPFDLPRFTTSAMDGFAVRGAEVRPSARLRVVARSMAGAPWMGTLGPGEAVAIATGGLVPPGADTVVPIEQVSVDGSFAVITEPARPGQHVRQAGEDVRAGEVVLPAGMALGATQLAGAAALGLTELLVRPRPAVAIIPTGDEVRPGGARLQPGEVFDAVSVALAVLVAQAGGVPVRREPVPDDPDALLRALGAASAAADLILTVGGVSVGDRDLLARLGDQVELTSVRVALRPARPFAFGTAFGTPLLALPGNPASALASFEEFARPAILALLGKPPVPRPAALAVLAEPLAGAPGVLNLVRARVWREGGRLMAASAGSQGAGSLGSLALANAWAVLPAGTAPLASGAEVDVRIIGEVGDSDPR